MSNNANKSNNNIIENRSGKMFFDGCSVEELAANYGTPLYLFSETEILRRISELKEAFADKYPNCRIAYASKAFCTLAMMDICNREALCVDVVSGGELFIAKSAGIPGEKIEFNGNNKSDSELQAAIGYGVGRIIVDGLNEVGRIESIVKEHRSGLSLERDGSRDSTLITASPAPYKQKILFRITPGVAADTHDHLITGKKGSKFGIPLDDEIFFAQVEAAINSDYIEFMGLHFHVGSQLFDVTPYMAALEILLEKVGEIYERFGVVVKEINLGGGFGVTYTAEERKPFDYFLAPMVERIHEFYRALGSSDISTEAFLPNIVIEPGRSIVAEAGATVYTIGEIKDVPGVRKFVSVDGGMGDNIRPALYQANYRSVLANKLDVSPNELVTISGKYCESGDILIQDAFLPNPERGDLLVMLSTGAYGYSMASNYNSNPIPAAVLCSNGTHRLIVKRQTYDQLIQNHLL